MQKQSPPLLALWLAVSYPFRKTYTANVCTHRTKSIGRVQAHGERYAIAMPLTENGNPDYCLDCIADMSIICAWCENHIHVGDPVTLYIPQESYKVPEHAVRYDADERCLIGCLGWDCADTGADRQGFWLPPGKVVLAVSPFEMIMAGKSHGQPVVYGDLSDPNDLGKVT
ncbi:MAG: hypothetical protein ACK42D_03465 [Candidatus Paceibacteria bacterium]